MTRKKSTAYVFLDTNIYLHFNDFDQIDWPNVLGYQSVCVVVPPIVFTELETFKYDRESQRRQQRARATAKKINDMAFSAAPGAEIPVPGRESVTLLVPADSPVTSLYPGLVQSVNDDQLIASMLKFSKEHPNVSREDLILVSDDGNVLNKARARNLTIRPMDDQYRLPDEPTVDQQKVAKLERRIQELEQREPQLALSLLKDGASSNEVELDIGIVPDLKPEQLDQFWATEAQAVEWRRHQEPPPAKSPPPKANPDEEPREYRSFQDVMQSVTESLSYSFARDFLGGVPPEEIERYEKEKTTYLSKYREFLSRLRNWQKLHYRISRVDLQILNSGSSPATGVLVQLFLPDELKVFDWDDHPRPPKKPEQPHKPRTQSELLGQTYAFPGVFGPNRASQSASTPPDPNSVGPRIIPHKSILLEWERPKVMHNVPLTLTPIGIEFPYVVGKQHYTVSYTLHAENLAVPAVGTLEISVRAEPRDVDLSSGNAPKGTSDHGPQDQR